MVGNTSPSSAPINFVRHRNEQRDGAHDYYHTNFPKQCVEAEEGKTCSTMLAHIYSRWQYHFGDGRLEISFHQIYKRSLSGAKKWNEIKWKWNNTRQKSFRTTGLKFIKMTIVLALLPFHCCCGCYCWRPSMFWASVRAQKLLNNSTAAHCLLQPELRARLLPLTDLWNGSNRITMHVRCHLIRPI